MSEQVQQPAAALARPRDSEPAQPAGFAGTAPARPDLAATSWLGWLAACPEVWVGVVAIALYLPVASRVLILGPDAVEYLDIGRRLAAGEGFMLGVKAFHFGGTEVLHHGLAERPPLFPVLIAGLFLLGFGPVSVQVLNAVLTGLSVMLVALVGRRLFGREVGLLAAVLAAASPLVLERMIWPMTEALTIALSLGATWLAMRTPERPSARSLGVAGLLLGLAYLARPTVLANIAALVPVLLLLVRDRRAALRPLAAFAAGALVSIAPISLYSVLTRGSVFYSGQTYLYAVYKDPEVMEYGFSRALPTAGEFVRQNSALVAHAIAETFGAYAYLLLAEWELLLPLALGWPGVLWAIGRGRYDRAAAVPLTMAVSTFVVYALTWSTFQDRYLLLTLLLLLPFLVDGLRVGLGRVGVSTWRGWRLSLVHVVVGATVLIWGQHLLREYRWEFRYGIQPAGVRTDEGLTWTAPPRWVRDDDLWRVVSWVRARTGPRTVLTHAQPWPFTFFTGRPATLLPKNLPAQRLRELLVSYEVDYVLLDWRDRERRDYADYLEALEEQGVERQILGTYRIFDVRALRADTAR